MDLIAQTETTSLQEESFFSGVDAAAVARLDTFAYYRRYDPRQIVYFPDDVCDYVYWVRSGRVKITRVSGSGREIAFRHLLKGDMFGEECLVNRPVRQDYAEAITETTLTLVRAVDFLRIVREESEICYAVACHVCRRALEMETALSENVFVDVRKRVAARLWRCYQQEQHRGSQSLYLTHQEIANLAGAARETVTNVLHQLQAQGVIRLENRRIHVRNPAQLRDMAQAAEK